MPPTPQPLFMLTADPVPERPPFAVGVGTGAMVVFEGIVRDNNEGKRVTELEYVAYPALAEREGSRIVQDSIERFGLLACCCIHRTGVLRPGDVAVRVWAAGAHRQEAFLACERVIDEVKASVPLWKREVYADGGGAWVTCEHHAASADPGAGSPAVQLAAGFRSR
jgi:molybdopterin synthase catalytic subunit